MIASLDPFAIVLLATLAAACLGLVWRAAHSGTARHSPGAVTRSVPFVRLRES
jgi:hypothetical protein